MAAMVASGKSVHQSGETNIAVASPSLLLNGRMVFEDPAGLRWVTIIRYLCLTAVGVLFTLSQLFVGQSSDPVLPDLRADAGTLPSSAFVAHSLGDPAFELRPPHDETASSLFQGLRAMRSAFVAQDDPDSVASLKSHLMDLQVVFPDWLRVSSADGHVVVSVKASVAQMIKSAGTAVVPRLSNTDSNGTYLGGMLAKLFTDEDATRAFIGQLAAALKSTGAAGVNIDIEEMPAADGPAYVGWLTKVTAALHLQGLAVTIDLPMSDEAYNYTALGAVADAVVLMAYDQHWMTSPAGPIAAQSWFEDNLDTALKAIPAQKLIVGIGAYGYDWTVGRKEAEAISFETAMVRANRFAAKVATDPGAINTTFDYSDEKGLQHHIWLLDGVSAWNQYRVAAERQVKGLALWRTGLEESSLWSFFGLGKASSFDPKRLASAAALPIASYRGQGMLLRVTNAELKGERSLDFYGDHITSARFLRLPGGFNVERFGSSDARQIVLTFDDGPDPTWTPEILDVLQQHGVPATFFVVGQQAERYPGIVAKAFAAGHLIGNHTYTHPDLTRIGSQQLDRELDLAQRSIEAATGHSTTLFRAPYSTDSEPSDASELAPLVTVNADGYVVAAADVDPKDYMPVSARSLVKRIMARLGDGKTHVIVFHDAGGNRHQTALALQQLIPMLKASGYEIVGLDRLMGLQRSEIMPRIPLSENIFVTTNLICQLAMGLGWQALLAVFMVAIVIAAVRLALLCYLIFTRTDTSPASSLRGFAPAVRVLIPAHNEATVIARTLAALAISDYPDFKITVIDDGSRDATANVVRQVMARDPRVNLITQPNGGKSTALNRGFREACEDIVITIDADTIVAPQTIRRLVEPFADPQIDAVCGNVTVGNVCNLLTAFQNVEYITAQNFDRRAFERLNCIWVVPGATGAWRRAKVLAAGGYSSETLTEDTDLTQTLLANGGRVVCADDARSVTEAPETVAALYGQRFRWNYGTLQCLWKHRANWGRGSVGWVAMPNMLLFQFLLPLIAPLGDLILIRAAVQRELPTIAICYLAFLGMDLLVSAIAFRRDQKSLAGIWVVLIQRLCYRQFMYVVTFLTLMAAAKGRRHGWNKLKRTGAAAGAVTAVAPRPGRRLAIAPVN